jgi:hypothetical protein
VCEIPENMVRRSCEPMASEADTKAISISRLMRISATRTVCVRSCAVSMRFLTFAVWAKVPHKSDVKKAMRASANMISMSVKPCSCRERMVISSPPRSP